MLAPCWPLAELCLCQLPAICRSELGNAESLVAVHKVRCNDCRRVSQGEGTSTLMTWDIVEICMPSVGPIRCSGLYQTELQEWETEQPFPQAGNL